MKKTCLLILIISIGICLAAVSRNDFVIGAYSQYQLHHAHQTELVFDDLAKLLSEHGFNTVLYSTNYVDVPNGRLAMALKALNRYKMGSIIDDWAFEKRGPVGITAMAHGNYLKMEAEYKWDHTKSKYTPEVFKGDQADNDLYNTVFRHETGRRSKQDKAQYSNSYAWICDASQGDKAGVALSEPRFRWMPQDKQFPLLLSSNLRFFTSATDNKLYLRVALKWQDIPQGAKIASVGIKALKSSAMASRDPGYSIHPETAYQDLELYSTQPELYTNFITGQDYPGLPRDPKTGAYIFEYYTPLPAINTPLYKEIMGGGYFNHLSPTLYWYGTGKLEIDYLEIEDELHRAMTSSSHPLKEGLDARLAQYANIPGSQSILYFYGKDEPDQGQFDSFRELEEYLKEKNLDLITATNLGHPFSKKPGGLPDYFHFGLFLQEAKPSVVMLDAYPLQEWGTGAGTLMRWNEDFKHSLFIQNKMQDYMLDSYEVLAKAVKHSANPSQTRLFFVPQTFGEKIEPLDTGEWLYYMPPLSMIKCLQLLPLCYAADGVIDFALTSNRNQDFPYRDKKFKRMTPLAHQDNYLNLAAVPGESFLQNLAQANAKLAVYGPIIQKLNWQDADSLMVNRNNPRFRIKDYLLSNLQVKRTGNGFYEGYVQCGIYLDENNIPSLMLVNRRAIYKPDGPGPTSWNLESHFVDADPQTVKIELNKDVANSYALFDPFYNHLICSADGVYEIEIPAGDGILIQLQKLENTKAAPPAKRSWFKRAFGIK